MALTDLVHGLVAGALDAEVDHGVGEGPAHVELQGQVVHTLRVLGRGRRQVRALIYYS